MYQVKVLIKFFSRHNLTSLNIKYTCLPSCAKQKTIPNCFLTRTSNNGVIAKEKRRQCLLLIETAFDSGRIILKNKQVEIKFTKQALLTTSYYPAHPIGQ